VIERLQGLRIDPVLDFVGAICGYSREAMIL